MKTLLLCGGRGTRAHPITETMPKALMPIHGRPIVDHLIDVFARQGRTDFIIAAGYRAADLVAYGSTRTDVRVTVVDTGESSSKGERIRRCAHLLDGPFVATYGDGLGNVDLAALAARHEACGGLATVTTVPLRSQYGILDVDGTRITAFLEKPIIPDRLVNAGFMQFAEHALDGLAGDLEDDMLPALARRGELHHHLHRGFWRSMDTQKDMEELNELAGAAAPWFDPPGSGAAEEVGS